MPAQIQPFGTLNNGQQVDIITIADDTIRASFLTRGAALQDIRIPGVDHPLTLGSNDIAAYEGPMHHFGAIVGPVANRINNATAILDDKTYNFPKNERDRTTLHSGDIGIHGQIWTLTAHTATSATFEIQLKDGENGFPGNRTLTANYQITAPGQITMTLSATTDKTTPINLANHSYWNLDGTDGTAGHHLQIDADAYLPINDIQIPTGEIKDVSNTPFDYRKNRRIGTDSNDRIDHNVCLSDAPQPLRKVATLTGATGISLTLETTEAGFQIYDAENVKTAPYKGYSGFPYGPYCGIAMESQGYPDAPNQPNFPQITVQAGAQYRQTTRWTFAKS
ncbi:MAG: aldose epimerase family protein [Paracoccaceae bacterium]